MIISTKGRTSEEKKEKDKKDKAFANLYKKKKKPAKKTGYTDLSEHFLHPVY